MSRTLTLITLKTNNACNEQVELFQKLFGDSVEITPELCIKHANDFDFTWAANNLLSKSSLYKYRNIRDTEYAIYINERNTEWGKYLTKETMARNKYNISRNTTSNEYNDKNSVVYKKYYAERKSASDKYDNKTNTIYNKFCAEKASAFANAYINDIGD